MSTGPRVLFQPQVCGPVHYLSLSTWRTVGLYQAALLQGWKLCEEFCTLRRLLDFHMGRRGERKYVQVLGLPEAFSQQEEAEAVKGSHRMGAISFDAVKHLVLCWQPHLDMELYPYLPGSGSTPPLPGTTRGRFR